MAVSVALNLDLSSLNVSTGNDDTNVSGDFSYGFSHANGTTGDDARSLPIVIAGGGCVGLFLALLLAQSDIPNKVVVIEPQQPDPMSTRAMAHQPPTYPILSKVEGLLPELVKTGSLSSGLCFRTSIQNGSKVIAGKTFDNSGEGMKGKGQLLLPQGKFQQVLMKRLAALGDEKAEVRLGTSVSSFKSTPSSVTLQITPEATSMQLGDESLEALYLIDASGAHSTIRKDLNISLEGETLDAQLVATDLHFDFHAHGFHDANFIMDPQNYGLIGRIDHARDGKPALWRMSYGVPIGVSEEDIMRTLDEKLRVMMPDEGRDGQGNKAYEVVRVAPYKAQQRLVPSLYHHDSRVCLVGDAAHLTNPYAGLGLASGMADASSLSEVLIRVLTGKASDDERLLNAWSTARRESFLNVVDKP